MTRHSRFPAKTIMLVVALFAPSTRATLVAPMTVERMADLAAQVVSGQVIALRSYAVDRPRGLETEVTFGEVTCWKGQPVEAGTTISLRVPGGQLGRMRMRITGAPDFTVGDRWVLFILPSYRTHPVVGLYRGAFRVIRDSAGIDRVVNVDGQAVTGIDPQGMIRVASDTVAHNVHPLREEQGVHARAGPTSSTFMEAMTLESFQSQLAPILARSRTYVLAAGVGQPARPTYTPTSLRPGRAAAAVVAPASEPLQDTIITTGRASGAAKAVPGASRLFGSTVPAEDGFAPGSPEQEAGP